MIKKEEIIPKQENEQNKIIEEAQDEEISFKNKHSDRSESDQSKASTEILM